MDKETQKINYNPKSLDNLVSMPSKWGEGTKTTTIRVPEELKETILVIAEAVHMNNLLPILRLMDYSKFSLLDDVLEEARVDLLEVFLEELFTLYTTNKDEKMKVKIQSLILITGTVIGKIEIAEELAIKISKEVNK